MRRFKKGLAAAMSLVLAVGTLSFQPTEAAKKPKLSKTKASISVGKTLKLTVKNAKKKAKVTWKTSKKSVAKITKKSTKGKKAYAKVQGMKKGSAKITASYKLGKTKKKMTCKVTVTDPSSGKKPTNTPTGTPTNKPTGSSQATATAIPTATPTPTEVPTPSPTPRGDKYTDEQGVYHHYLGMILDNPSSIYGESYNNHHHMQSYKGHDYIFYHSTVLCNTMYRDNKQYRNLHVDEINVNADTDEITIKPSYEGASQIEAFNPYTNFDGSKKYINATTAASSAGVTSTRDDLKVAESKNGSPMVLDKIDTGDWTMIKGVDFGETGLKSFGVEYKAGADKGRIEMFIDSPTKLANKVATINILEATQGYQIKTVNPAQPVTGQHDVYFVFRGSNYQVASWILSSDEEAAEGQEEEASEFEPSTQDYEFFNDYTLGWNGGKIVAYKDGQRAESLEAAGAGVYNKETDDIFAQHISANDWSKDKIILTQPMQYTTTDGVAHNIDSMLTNFDFVADPTAIDNSKNDGKLYVYGTTEGIEYKNGVLETNHYNNHSLTILSTQDMVNWTDEGRLDNQNLTNLPSTDTDNMVKTGWAEKAWAPSGLKFDGDGDGKDEYYIFYTNSGAVGYVQGDSPTGPWKDDLGKVLFNQRTKNCSGVVWCFDPAVLVDDKNNAYVYFGGGTNKNYASGKTARVCKIKFEEGTGKVLLDGDPQVLDNYYMFEDSEINQFNGKYYYSYCTNFNVPGKDKWIRSGVIACYVSTDPMNISYNPASWE